MVAARVWVLYFSLYINLTLFLDPHKTEGVTNKSMKVNMLWALTCVFSCTLFRVAFVESPGKLTTFAVVKTSSYGILFVYLIRVRCTPLSKIFTQMICLES